MVGIPVVPGPTGPAPPVGETHSRSVPILAPGTGVFATGLVIGFEAS